MTSIPASGPIAIGFVELLPTSGPKPSSAFVSSSITNPLTSIQSPLSKADRLCCPIIRRCREEMRATTERRNLDLATAHWKELAMKCETNSQLSIGLNVV